MVEQTVFVRECTARGWTTPAAFLAAFTDAARDVGEDIEVTDRQFRRWRQPNPPRPRPRAWRVLHAMFGTDPARLGFPAPPPGTTAPTSTTARQGGAGVERRAFVADTIGAAAGTALPASGAVGTVHLTELREGLRSLYTLDDAYGGGDVRSLAVRHLRRVRRVINTATYPEAIGRQLQLVAGEAAEMCGWLSFDADRQDDARRFWGEALTTATMLRDDGLQVLVLASLSMQAIHEGRPRDGYDLARAARERADAMGSPVLVSILAAREARALAGLGDHTGARRELAAAMRVLERDGRGHHAPPWAAFHGPAELDYAQGLLNTEAGHHRAAVPFLRAARARQGATYGRNRALYRLTLAGSLVRAGEVDEGAAEAVGALEHLAEVESGRVARRLGEVRGMLTDTDARAANDAVQALAEHAKRGQADG